MGALALQRRHEGLNDPPESPYFFNLSSAIQMGFNLFLRGVSFLNLKDSSSGSLNVVGLVETQLDPALLESWWSRSTLPGVNFEKQKIGSNLSPGFERDQIQHSGKRASFKKLEPSVSSKLYKD